MHSCPEHPRSGLRLPESATDGPGDTSAVAMSRCRHASRRYRRPRWRHRRRRVAKRRPPPRPSRRRPLGRLAHGVSDDWLANAANAFAVVLGCVAVVGLVWKGRTSLRHRRQGSGLAPPVVQPSPAEPDSTPEPTPPVPASVPPDDLERRRIELAEAQLQLAQARHEHETKPRLRVKRDGFFTTRPPDHVAIGLTVTNTGNAYATDVLVRVYLDEQVIGQSSSRTSARTRPSRARRSYLPSTCRTGVAPSSGRGRCGCAQPPSRGRRVVAGRTRLAARIACTLPRWMGRMACRVRSWNAAPTVSAAARFADPPSWSPSWVSARTCCSSMSTTSARAS